MEGDDVALLVSGAIGEGIAFDEEGRGAEDGGIGFPVAEGVEALVDDGPVGHDAGQAGGLDAAGLDGNDELADGDGADVGNVGAAAFQAIAMVSLRKAMRGFWEVRRVSLGNSRSLT